MSYKIVKEVDKLGRIVLPKNIRQHLKVKPGDGVCLDISRDNVVLSKDNKVKNISDFGELICESIYEMSGYICLITDGEKVVCASGITKSVLGKTVKIDDDKIKFEDKEIVIKQSISTDIICNQKNVGQIIILAKNTIDEKLKSTIEVISRYIGKLING